MNLIIRGQRFIHFFLVILNFSFLVSCMTVGPKYEKPSALVPAAYKEGWKRAEPAEFNGKVVPGKWWEVFSDSELNLLIEKVNTSNQTIAGAYASFLQAEALVKEARAQYFPSVSIGLSAGAQKGQGVTSGFQAAGGAFEQYSVPLSASWVPDLWGRIKNTVAQNTANAQASAADLAYMRLTQQASLATYYYELRAQDEIMGLYRSTVDAYRKTLNLTQALFETGIDSDESVAQAEAQLLTTEAQATNLGIARAQYEHAIALLIGVPASSFTLAPQAWDPSSPDIPTGIPTALLERRPDVVAAERSIAAANAQIGIGMAAYYPNLTLTGGMGIGNNSYTGLFSVPYFVWSLGASFSELIFNGGLREATVEQYKAYYEQTAANYRQTVLTAFQQVEDALAQIRILSQGIQQQDRAVKASERYLKIATHRYRLGIDPYLNVLSAQVLLLSNRQTAITLRMQQRVGSVQLVEALGGGWNASKVPTPKGL